MIHRVVTRQCHHLRASSLSFEMSYPRSIPSHPLQEPSPTLHHRSLLRQCHTHFPLPVVLSVNSNHVFSSTGKSGLEMIPLLHLVLLWDEQFNRWEDLFLFHLLCTYHNEDNRPVFGFTHRGQNYHYRLHYGTDNTPWLQERLLTVTTSSLDFSRYTQYLLSHQSERNHASPSLSPALPLNQQ